MRALATLLATTVAASAEQVPAPDYFVATVVETSTAQQLALSCPTLSIDPVKAARRTEDVLTRLSEDGFTPENLETRMADPAEAIAALQNAFLAKHQLADGASTEAVCAAGKAEIAEDSAIGALLLEVDG